MTALVLIETITEVKSDKSTFFITTLDVKRGIDMVDHEALFHKLDTECFQTEPWSLLRFTE